jgi:hypothetical protein
MDQEKNKNRIVILLVVLVVALTTFCMLLVTGVISFEKDVSDNKQHNDINEQKNNNIQSKRESIGCMDIDTVFNGITIKAKPEHDKGCHTESIVINDNVVSPGGNISSYEIYDNNVSIVSGIVCIIGYVFALMALPSLKVSLFLWSVCCVFDDIGWLIVYAKNKKTLREIE